MTTRSISLRSWLVLIPLVALFVTLSANIVSMAVGSASQHATPVRLTQTDDKKPGKGGRQVAQTDDKKPGKGLRPVAQTDDKKPGKGLI